MKRVFFSILLISTIMFTGIGHASELFPLSIGNYWKTQMVEDPGSHDTIKVIGTANLRGVQAYVLEVQETVYGDTEIGFYFAREINQVLYGYGGGGKIETPFRTGPIGTKWSYTDAYGDLVVVEIVGIEDVTVPAGFFPGTYHYHITVYVDGVMDDSRDEWLHPGTGRVYWVDYTHLPPAQQEHWELVEYSVR